MKARGMVAPSGVAPESAGYEPTVAAALPRGSIAVHKPSCPQFGTQAGPIRWPCDCGASNFGPDGCHCVSCLMEAGNDPQTELPWTCEIMSLYALHRKGREGVPSMDRRGR